MSCASSGSRHPSAGQHKPVAPLLNARAAEAGPTRAAPASTACMHAEPVPEPDRPADAVWAPGKEARLLMHATSQLRELSQLRDALANAKAEAGDARKEVGQLQEEIRRQQADGRLAGRKAAEETARLSSQLRSCELARQEQQRLVEHYRGEGEAVLLQMASPRLSAEVQQLKGKLSSREAECEALTAQMAMQTALVETYGHELTELRQQVGRLIAGNETGAPT